MNEVSSDTKAKALRVILGVMLDTVKECGEQGAPAGVMYSAANGRIHMSLAQFQAVMGALESAGKVRKEGFVYYFVADL